MVASAHRAGTRGPSRNISGYLKAAGIAVQGLAAGGAQQNQKPAISEEVSTDLERTPTEHRPSTIT